MNVFPNRTCGSAASVRSTLSVDNPRLFFAAVVLSVVPLWFGRYLPMVDLPGHAAVIAALQEILHGNPIFSTAFEAHWTSPYMLGYALLYAASALLSPTLAAKVVVSSAVAATSLMTAILLRAAGADQRWKWLAIPASYSYAFYWGFVSFIVAVPMALLLLVLTIRFDGSATLRRSVLIALTTIVLFYSHIIVMGFACLISLAYLGAKNYGSLRQLVLRSLPYATPIPLIAIWFASDQTGAADAPIRFGSWISRLTLLLVQPAGFERLSLLAIPITVSILVLPPLAGSRLTRSPARWLPVGLCLAIFLAAPSYAYLTGFLYERMGVFLVPLYLLLWDPPAERRENLAWLAMPLVLAWLFVNVSRFASFSRETQDFDVILKAVPPHKRVGALILNPNTPLFGTPVYLHFTSWYQATRRGIVDFNFAEFRSVLHYRQADSPRITEQLSWYPQLFDWESHGGKSYDYFVVKGDINVDLAPRLFREHMDSIELVAHSRWWWLYRNKSN